MDYTIEKSILDQEGRYVILQAKIQDSSILLINYYAPNMEGTQITLLSEINDVINNLVLEEDTTILWGGDFNSFFDVNLDWRQMNPFKQRRLDNFFISDNLQDLVEHVNIIPSVQSDHSALKLKLSPLNEREVSHFGSSIIH